ncbi:MAG TPA: 50S ribosomal protein L35 [Candidatus Paceibacterota bacterium]|jgi:large subunit ribosomal protein L35|nr:50S ribosomal protein L35 [Candidatus Paceibacterota bacterium]
MPKVKTHKGAAKRLRKTKSGKLMHRASGQDHFNSRDTGKVTKNKRRDVTMHASHNKIKSLIPYK